MEHVPRMKRSWRRCPAADPGYKAIDNITSDWKRCGRIGKHGPGVFNYDRDWQEPEAALKPIEGSL